MNEQRRGSGLSLSCRDEGSELFDFIKEEIDQSTMRHRLVGKEGFPVERDQKYSCAN